MRNLYRYTFDTAAPAEAIEGTLLLALLAVESLHGESGARLDAAHHFDESRPACVIDAGTDVGRDLNRLFVGFLRHELGADGFRVERLDAVPAPLQEAAVS
jgi:hypothetical protein